jgi:hypothetical protein
VARLFEMILEEVCADRCHFPMAARLHAQDTETVLDIVEGDAFDQAGDGLLCGWGWAWFHG